MSTGETLTRLPQPAANIPAGIFFLAAALFFLGAEASWFADHTRRGLRNGSLWAIGAFLASAVVIVGTALLFSGF